VVLQLYRKSYAVRSAFLATATLRDSYILTRNDTMSDDTFLCLYAVTCTMDMYWWTRCVQTESLWLSRDCLTFAIIMCAGSINSFVLSTLIESEAEKGTGCSGSNCHSARSIIRAVAVYNWNPPHHHHTRRLLQFSSDVYKQRFQLLFCPRCSQS